MRKFQPLATLFSQMPKSHFNTFMPFTTSSSSIACLIDAYNLPSDSAAFISNKLKITNPDGVKLPAKEKLIQHCFSVFGILKDYGFSGTQIAKLIRKRPKTLGVRSKEALRDRLKFLEERGFKGKNLGKFIVANPLVIDRGVKARLLPAWEFLRTCVGTDDNVKMAVRKYPWLLSANLNNTVQPNVVLLMDNGVPLDSISKLIVSHPRSILQHSERMAHVIKDLKDVGRDPRSPMFLYAVKVMVNMSEGTWIKKKETLRSIGLSDEDVKFLYQKYPICLACSEKKIRAAFDFLLNTMKLDLRTIVAQPLILMYRLEGRVRPRLNVLKILKSKKLVKENVNLNLVMTVSEKRFLKKYVVPNEELVPGLMDEYRSSMPASL